MSDHKCQINPLLLDEKANDFQTLVFRDNRGDGRVMNALRAFVHICISMPAVSRLRDQIGRVRCFPKRFLPDRKDPYGFCLCDDPEFSNWRPKNVWNEIQRACSANQQNFRQKLKIQPSKSEARNSNSIQFSASTEISINRELLSLRRESCSRQLLIRLLG